MRSISDDMCQREGLTVIRNPKKKKTPRPIYIAEKNGGPTKNNLMREAIDRALSMSWDNNSFVDVMRSQGYDVNLGFHRMYATIRSVNAKRATRMYHLGAQYDKDAICTRLDENFNYDYETVRQRYERYMDPYCRQWVIAHPPGKEYESRRKFYFANCIYSVVAAHSVRRYGATEQLLSNSNVSIQSR